MPSHPEQVSIELPSEMSFGIGERASTLRPGGRIHQQRERIKLWRTFSVQYLFAGKKNDG